MIYHIVNKDKWTDRKRSQCYTSGSLEREGYIHCSFENQVLKVAETFYKGDQNLLILCINENKLNCEMKVEDLFNMNEKYPHVYGQIPERAIEKVVDLKVDCNGNFIKPNLLPLSSLRVEQGEWT